MYLLKIINEKQIFIHFFFALATGGGTAGKKAAGLATEGIQEQVLALPSPSMSPKVPKERTLFLEIVPVPPNEQNIILDNDNHSVVSDGINNTDGFSSPPIAGFNDKENTDGKHQII